MASHSCFDHQYRVLLPNGELRWVHARGNCIAGQDGQLTDLDGTCQDITEQKKNEAIQASLESQLRESQKMEAIGTLAGGIAHDFNNILAAILGNVEIAIDESRDASPIVTRCLEDTLKAGFRARNLVQQILSFSRRQPTDRRLLAPGPVIAETVKLLRATLPARLTLEVNLADDVPPVMADATQLEQVLINLATNALHAVKGQAGRLRICLDSVAVTDTLAAARPELQGRFPEIAVRLTISDTGYGMDAATRQRIFEPFFTTKAVDEGTGLGLAVVHGIVQRHDGVILVDSQPGEGTTFTIYLPAASVQPGPAADQQSGSQVSVNPQQTAVLTSPLHVLYLDDDTSVLFMVRQLFERKGYRVSCFSDQNEALDAVRRSPSEFSIVVTDYNMPGMQGTDVAREVRLIRPDLPVAVTSGFIDEELLAEADQCGVKRLISKPFELELFFCEIQRLALSSAENLQASDYSG